MKSIIIISFTVCALGFCETAYESYWTTDKYPDSLAIIMAGTHSGEQLAQEIQRAKSPEATFELGRLYYARGLYHQALAFFQQTDFGGDLRSYHIGLCYLVLDEKDSAQVWLSKTSDPRLRAWSSAALAKISKNSPAVLNDYPYLAGFFETQPAATPAVQKGFTLQFGAFADSARAEQMVQMLKDIGLSPYIVKIVVNDKTLFRVRAERFASKEEAQQAGSALGDQFIFMIVPEE